MKLEVKITLFDKIGKLKTFIRLGYSYNGDWQNVFSISHAPGVWFGSIWWKRFQIGKLKRDS